MKYALILWAVWYAYWIVSARNRVRAKKDDASVRRESVTGRVAYSAVLLAGSVLLLLNYPRGFLDRRAWTSSLASIAIGLVMEAAGMAFAIWARQTLGGNWSGRITTGGSQELVIRGPYRIVRHPIYSGLLLAIVGTAFVRGDIRGLVGAALLFAGVLVKIRREEEALRQHFGPAYEAYERRVGGLLPGWH